MIDLAARTCLFAAAATMAGTLALAPTPVGAAPIPADRLEFFEKKIRPVLIEQCYECHSSESKKVKGGLLLDTREGLLKGGDNGPAIVPGEPDKSLLIKAVRYTDPDLQMPKDKKLSDTQIADLAAWVRMGAPDPRTNRVPATVAQADMEAEIRAARQEWPYQRPQAPPLPKVRNESWIQSPLDRFILAKLEAKELSPARAADKRTLIRRATFDLTGLPPTIEEVNAFLADKSTDAFARVVDRLLASPHYGERWGRHWLDVVRYTDSFDARGIGGEADVPEAYRYRDWVVNAFNDDLPYDQFITHQIAGDILATNTASFDPKKLIATGVYVIGEWGTGDADKEKMLTDIVDDQVDLTGRAFLGLTLACARCHDHKFDPISARDYYAMAGIFFSSHILPDPGLKTAGSPVLRLPLASPQEIAARKRRDERIRELEDGIEKGTDEQVARELRKLLAESEHYLLAASDYHAKGRDHLSGRRASDLRPEPLRFWLEYLSGPQLALLKKPVKDVAGKPGLHAWQFEGGADTPSVTANSTDADVQFVTITMPPRSLAVHPSPKAGVAVAWRSPANARVKVAARLSDADGNCGNGIEWKLNHRHGRESTELDAGHFENGGKSKSRPGGASSASPLAGTLVPVALATGDSIELIVLPRGAYECDTTVVQLEITEVDGNRKWDLTREVVGDLHASNPHADALGNPEVWHFYDVGRGNEKKLTPGSLLAQWALTPGPVGPGGASSASPAATLVAATREIQNLLMTGKFDTNIAHTGLESVYKEWTNPRGTIGNELRKDTSIFSPEFLSHRAAMQTELGELKKQQTSTIPVAHGLQEGGTPKSAHDGIRDARVHLRGRYDRLGDVVPRAFPRVLAEFEQPKINGRHASFGSHASGRMELARWIASAENPLTARVMANRLWQHHFGEGIVRTPNNYGKLGVPPTHPELLDYLATEFVKSGWSIKAMHRAIMLSATYQQSSVPGGASSASPMASTPVDPANELFGRMNRRRLESEAVRDSLLAVAGTLAPTVGGPAIRDLKTPRRTLYVMTVRSDRATYQSLFDAADPTGIVEKRTVSTVAPQALFLLNHPFALEQTKALALRLPETAPTRERIQWLYETLYARLPSEEEQRVGRDVLGLAPDAEAWEQYCHVLLCANEFIYID